MAMNKQFQDMQKRLAKADTARATQ